MKHLLTAFALCLTFGLSAQIAVDSTELELRALRMELATVKANYRALQAEKVTAAQSRDHARALRRQNGCGWFILGAGVATLVACTFGGYRAIYTSSK
jgi:hypothetical protein